MVFFWEVLKEEEEKGENLKTINKCIRVTISLLFNEINFNFVSSYKTTKVCVEFFQIRTQYTFLLDFYLDTSWFLKGI